MSLHTGTHIDAPSHFAEGAPSIDALPLEHFLGIARVVELPGRGEIAPAAIIGLDLDGVERVLLKTNSACDESYYNTDFAYLTAESARALASHPLRLLGIDTPSVDRWDSKTLDAHRALLTGGISILENLALGAVPAGDYELIALPLKLVGLDAAPVRAVLRSLP